MAASVLVMLMALSGCSDDDEAGGPVFQAVSYNAGLARGFVPGAVERTPLVSAGVGLLAADVVCLQEVWVDEDVAAFQAAASSYPTQIFPPATGPGTPGPAPCTQADFQPLLDCVLAEGCDTVCGDDQVGCVIGGCGTEFQELTSNAPECSQCIQANVGAPVDDIVTACTSESAEWAFGGSFGLGLLSKAPVVDEDFLTLDSTTNRRGAIYAQLSTPLGPVHTFCTHLTAVFDESSIPYPRAEGSWLEEQRAQIDTLLAWVAEKSAGGPVMLLGDFNTGPAGPTYAAEIPEHYAALLGGGFSAPYVESGGPCTYCGTNPLVGGGDDVLIDHAFISGFASPDISSLRIFDQPVTVNICGADQAATFSDHYGLGITFNQP